MKKDVNKGMEYDSDGVLKLLTMKDVANKLGVCRQTASKIMKSKSFPSVSVGGRLMVSVKDFNIWIDKLGR